MSAGFRNCHPWVSVIFFLSVIAFGMFVVHPACLLPSFIFACAYDIRLKGKKSAGRLILLVIPMIIFVTAVNTLFSHYGVTVLFQTNGGNNITFEAMINGFITGVAAVSVTIWFFCFNEVVTADKIMSVLSFLSPKAALMISMALRFVPLYRKKYAQIAQVQKASGADTGSLINKIKNAVSCVSILITWSLENAVETSDSMKARGFGAKGRTSYSRFVFTRQDLLLILLIAAADITVAFAALTGGLYCSYNPYVMINPPAQFSVTYILTDINAVINPFTPSGVAAAAAYFLLCAMPLIIDAKEGLKWRRLKSKI